MAEIYISTDVETDGPIPGPHSMLSFGSAAFTADKRLLGTFSANLELLPGAAGDPKTMQWWQSQPEAWAACRADARRPEDVMPEYVKWLKGQPGRVVFVAYPACFSVVACQDAVGFGIADESAYTSNMAAPISLADLRLKPAQYRAVRKRAERMGQTPPQYIRALVERDLLIGESFDDVLRPIRAGFKDSGVSEHELDDLVKAARKDLHARPRRKRGRAGGA